MAKTPAWQRKEGKNPSGGLNAKGRASYNRATGGNLKAPSKKVGNKRRASFCARMKGMKKKLTSKKTVQALSASEYAATTAAKRKGKAKGKQFVKQPKGIAKKVKQYRSFA